MGREEGQSEKIIVTVARLVRVEKGAWNYRGKEAGQAKAPEHLRWAVLQTLRPPRPPGLSDHLPAVSGSKSTAREYSYGRVIVLLSKLALGSSISLAQET